MAIYPTKTSKISNKNKKLKVGIALTSVFSIFLILLVFNFFQIFTKFILGTFGLLIFPICLFFVILGILFMLNKTIKTSKSILIFSILWSFVFILILQLATSKNIDNDFVTYLSTTFKSNLTAGGVIFGIILYPLYYLTFDVATYIILIIILLIFTSILIDRVYIEIKNKKATILENNDDINKKELVKENNENELVQDSNNSNNEKPKNIEDEIFISDDDDSEEKKEAKSILGLSKEKAINENSSQEIDYAKKLESQFDSSNNSSGNDDIDSNVINVSKKPSIFVHEDEFNSIGNIDIKSDNEIKNESPKIVDKDEERKKAALDYLNISKGKFETKAVKPGFDNVKPILTEKQESLNLINQNNENNNRLSKLNEKLDLISNNQKEASIGINPFKKLESSNSSINSENNDIFDENFTKKDFLKNQELYSKNNSNINNAINNLPELAKKAYSGEVNNNIVENTSFRPVQISIDEPKVNLKPIQQKIYKKPPTYIKPPIDLLKKYSSNIDDDSEYIAEKGQLIVDTLKSFKIDTKIINAVKGPTFTRYELQMAPGISVNSVNNKINDLSMALESPCRVQVPIPGKNAFGIEVPNKNRITVGLREMLESSNFQNSKSPLTFALGKDIGGNCKVACIDKLVHTLVAGSTGSGKSVCLNTMLVSLLYKASPEDLRLILVDPKTVEFSLFNNLPHLLIPNTITECDKAISALSWLVDEMDRRYKKLNSLGVKKISEYNETPEVISGAIPKMYYIVMVFDEVGDFMNRAKKEIEEKILLLAAKSRACGIHLVLATQRPTVDVITGTIKANLPSRIAFAVNSYNDSKTILENSGAEYLLGMGDMLFLPQGTNEMDRIQGCYIDNNELKSIINFVKENNEAEFDEEIEDQMFNKKDGFDGSNGSDESFDPMLKDCLRYFIKAKKASASSLQAYFGIGYPKANKIVLQMEKAGFVSPGDNNGRRVLYITQQEFEERFGENLDE